MAFESFDRCLALVVVLAVLPLSVGQGPSQNIPTGQDRSGAVVAAPRAPGVKVLSQVAKTRILGSKRVQAIALSRTLTYGVNHGRDKDGYLFFFHPFMLNYQGSEALLDGSSGAPSGVSLQFNPLAVNQTHLVIFTISVGSGPVQVSSQVGAAPLETKTYRNGTSYISVLVRPTTNAQVVVNISASGKNNFWFNRVTVELVK
jgi:hypothetical protein